MICTCTFITNRLITLILLGSLAFSGSALATPIIYQITFTTFSLPIPEKEGFFTYDPDLVKPFSDFHVIWEGVDFNLTDAANAPNINSDCGTFSPPQLTFALLSHTPSKCTGNSSVLAGFQGEQKFFSFVGSFDFNLNAYSLELLASIGKPCSLGVCNVGATIASFDIAPQVTTVPAPPTLLMIISGLASLGCYTVVQRYVKRWKKKRSFIPQLS